MKKFKRVLALAMAVILSVPTIITTGLGTVPVKAAGDTVELTVSGDSAEYAGYETHKMYAGGNYAYCIQPSKKTPKSGTFEKHYDVENYMAYAGDTSAAENLRHIAYYCWGAPGFDAKYFPATWYDGSAMNDDRYIALSHIILADAATYEGAEAMHGCNSTFKNWAYQNVLGFNTKGDLINEEAPRFKLTWQPVPSSFKIYVLDTGSTQKIMGYEYNPTGNLTLQKVSANESITSGNSCYSLSGATYGIYSDAGCTSQVGTLTTDSSGNSNVISLNEDTYYYKELTAPAGYEVDGAVKSIKVSASQTATIKASDTPTNDPVRISINKVDSETGDMVQGGASLENAEFTVKYYAGYYNAGNLPANATRTWVIKTLKTAGGNYMAALNNTCKVSGDDFYKVSNGTVVLPLGTISIEETKAPEGYKLDGAYLQVGGVGEKITGKYVAQILQNGNLAQLKGGNTFKVSDKIKRGDFKLTKIDTDNQNRMSDIPFRVAPEGTGYRAKTRFAKFFNLPELISLFKESADIQTADMLKLPVPECDYENVVLKPSEFQQEIVKSLGDRAENIRNGGVDSSIDNMLKVTSDGRKCAIDQRLINPELPDNENSKVNACAARAYDIWKETTKDKSTQLIFCDASTPRSDGGFDVYHAIKDKLIAKGVPDKEIAFIHDANTKKQKAELFSKVRSGQVRFLLGSTAKMGAGTNVQTRLIALHHIDVPWRPSDIEQQEGRILRQGNRNERVKIFRYVTENTFDSYSWQLIENKQKFIGQIMTSKSPVRSCDDVDEAALSYAEVKALATGNPYIKEKMTLDTEVAKLKLLKANFKSQKYRLEDAINKEYPVRIAKLEEKIEGLRQDIITRGPEEILSDGFEIRINGVPYDDKKEGGAALIAAARESKTPERTMIGDYKGFKLYSRFDAFFNLYYIHMQGRCEHTIEMSSDPAGMITRLNNCMAGFEKRLSDAQDALDETRIELETAEKEVTKKFDKEDILSEKLKRLSFLNAQLDADRKETPQNAPQNKQAQRNDIKEKYISI